MNVTAWSHHVCSEKIQCMLLLNFSLSVPVQAPGSWIGVTCFYTEPFLLSFSMLFTIASFMKDILSYMALSLHTLFCLYTPLFCGDFPSIVSVPQNVLCSLFTALWGNYSLYLFSFHSPTFKKILPSYL